MGQEKASFSDPVVIIAFIAAFFGDVFFILIFPHYILGFLVLVLMFPKAKGFLPNAALVVAWVLPAPLLILASIYVVAKSSDNKLIQLGTIVAEQAGIQAVAAVTGGFGEALEGAAAGAETAEVAAEVTEIAAEGAEATAETGAEAEEMGVEAEEGKKPMKKRLQRQGQSEDEENEEEQPEEGGSDEDEALDEEMQTESEKDPEDVARKGLFETPDATEAGGKEEAEEERPQKQDRPRRKVIDINLFKDVQRLQQQREEERRREEDESIDKAA